MRKCIVAVGVLITGLGLMGAGAGKPTTMAAAAQTLTRDEQSFLDKHLSDYVTTEATRLRPEILSKVFSAAFYNIRIRVKLGEDASEDVTVVVARYGDHLVSVEEPGAGMHLKAFAEMVAPSFKLKTEADATLLQEAMDVLYPVTARGNKKVVGFTHIGGTWYFSRGQSVGSVGGKYFDCHRGFQVKADAAGVITSVDYTLYLDGPLALDPQRR